MQVLVDCKEFGLPTKLLLNIIGSYTRHLSSRETFPADSALQGKNNIKMCKYQESKYIMPKVCTHFLLNMHFGTKVTHLYANEMLLLSLIHH